VFGDPLTAGVIGKFRTEVAEKTDFAGIWGLRDYVWPPVTQDHLWLDQASKLLAMAVDNRRMKLFARYAQPWQFGTPEKRGFRQRRRSSDSN
jgi:hypothetical protein